MPWLLALATGLGASAATAGLLVVTIEGRAAPVEERLQAVRHFAACEPPALVTPTGATFLSPGQFAAFAEQVLGAAGPSGCADAMPPSTALRSDAELLSEHVHLARERGLDPLVCNAANWRVVAILVDDCDQADAVARHHGGCSADIRIVAQPFAPGRLMAIPHDHALHVEYSADPDELRRDKLLLESLLVDSPPSACDDLRFRSFLAGILEHAAPGAVRRIGWATSSRSGQQWSFGRMVRDSEAGWRLETRPNGGAFDNFSKPELLRAGCGINRESSPSLLAAARCVPDSGTSRAGAAAEIARLQDAGLSLRSESHCVGCHMADQLALLVHHPQAAMEDPGPSLFARNGIKLGNQRHLGFRYDGVFWMSQRMSRHLETIGGGEDP